MVSVVGRATLAEKESFDAEIAKTQKDFSTKLSKATAKLQKEIEKLSTTQIETLQRRLFAIETAFVGFTQAQKDLDTRLGALEERAANIELTTGEIKEAYDVITGA